MKKRYLSGFIIGLMIIAMAAHVSANKIKIEIAESFPAGSNIDFKVMLYDDANNLINDNVNIKIEDTDKITSIEQSIEANKPSSISLGDNPKAGTWSITVSSQGIEQIKQFFTVESNDLVKFEIQGDKLYITNTGNSRYTSEIQIAIGDTINKKNIDLDIGQVTDFRLVAPNGIYNIRVTDGKTTITKSDVQLTGNVIGALDEKLVEGGSSVTGGLKPVDNEADQSFFSGLRSKGFVYVFIFVVIGAAVLLAFERNYKRKL